jgi:hypothetical protein
MHPLSGVYRGAFVVFLTFDSECAKILMLLGLMSGEFFIILLLCCYPLCGSVVCTHCLIFSLVG